MGLGRGGGLTVDDGWNAPRPPGIRSRGTIAVLGGLFSSAVAYLQACCYRAACDVACAQVRASLHVLIWLGLKARWCPT